MTCKNETSTSPHIFEGTAPIFSCLLVNVSLTRITSEAARPVVVNQPDTSWRRLNWSVWILRDWGKGNTEITAGMYQRPRSRKTEEICISLHFVLWFLAEAGAQLILIHLIRLPPLARCPCLFTFHQLPDSHLRRENLLPWCSDFTVKVVLSFQSYQKKTVH